MSILLATHSLIKDTHLHMQHTQRGVLILHAAIALRQPNGSLRHRKGTLVSFPPKKALVWEGFCGDLDSDFLGNLLWAIFSDQDKSAESCLFLFFEQGKVKADVCVWELRQNNYSWKLTPHPKSPTQTSPFPLTVPLSAFYPSLLSAEYSIMQPLCSIISLSNGFWVDPKKPIALDEYHLFVLFFLVVLKKALLNDSLEAHLQKQNYS